MKSYRTYLLFLASLLMFVLSLFLPLASVHTYCENRSVAAVFGVVSIAVPLFFFPSHAASMARKVVAGLAMTLCVLAVAVNVAFILYATHLCRHIFDQLH